MTDITQLMDLEIQIYGMVTLENEDQLLAGSLDEPRDPEFWDILVKTYPDGFDKDWYPLIEIENLAKDEVEPWLEKLRAIFPDAGEETV